MASFTRRVAWQGSVEGSVEASKDSDSSSWSKGQVFLVIGKPDVKLWMEGRIAQIQTAEELALRVKLIGSSQSS